MSKSAAAQNELAARLDALGIEAAELAAMIGRPAAEVTAWVAGDAEPDADARVLLRVLSDDADALRRVNHLRRAYQGDMRGAGIGYAGISGVPYGGGRQGVTGGRPE